MSRPSADANWGGGESPAKGLPADRGPAGAAGGAGAGAAGRRCAVIYRIRVAWHLRRNRWEALDFLFDCRWRWLCDRHDATYTATIHELRGT